MEFMIITRALRILGGSGILCILAAGPASADNRTIDGFGNNIDHPQWGQAFTQLMRLTPVMYEDGISEPAGSSRPNPRLISNAVCSQDGLAPNSRNLTDWVWQWGQFLDHDITLSEFMLPEEPFDVPVPAGDLWFDSQGTGEVVIPLSRSVYDPQTGTDAGNPRQQINQLTAFIDGSNVYGSDAERAQWLRRGDGGKLKTGPGNLLPFNDGSQVNAGPAGLPSFKTNLFTAGDIRCNEQSGLTAVHTLWVREHNRQCDEIAADRPDWTDEQIYQQARKMVGALLQVITYNEFLPKLLGPLAPDPRDAEYDPAMKPQIINSFANACYRVGHTMLSPQIMRINADGTDHPDGPLALRDAFFNTTHVLNGGIEPLLKGLASQNMQEIDPMVVDDVRNFLFGAPGAGGFDLASLNIQRARDHGLPDYNRLRAAFGLTPALSFADVSSAPVIQSRLASAYADVNDIDPWVGALSEDHLPGGNVGELIGTVLSEQFTRLRDGDRFFYRLDPDLSAADIAELEATTLADVILRNTDIVELQSDVFTVTSEGDSLCGSLPWFNIGLLFAALGLGRLGYRRHPGLEPQSDSNSKADQK